MNSTGNNLTAATIDAIIQDAYGSNIYNWLFVSSTMLTFYAALLKLPQEIEHIWSNTFSLPTWLYVFARYGTLAQQGLNLPLNFVPLGKTCDMLANASNSLQLLSFIGIQGLLTARAYALCQGHKISTMALAFGFLSILVLQLYGMISFPGCLLNVTAEDYTIAFSSNICVIFNSALILGICMWKVWGTWELKHKAGIQIKHSLISVLITQSILSCCFVTVITITDTVLSEVAIKNPLFAVLVLPQGFNCFQNALSSILVADFTLDLRSLNSANIEANNASLSPLQFSDVFQRVHQSFLVELATPEIINVEEGRDDDDDNLRHMENIPSVQA